MYTYNPYADAYLSHHGVQGQKWGVRRYRPYAKGEKPAGAKEVGEAAKKSKNDDIIKSADRKNIISNHSEMTNKDLKEAKERIMLLKDIDNLGYEFEHRKRKHTTDTLKAVGAVAVASLALYGNSEKMINTGKAISNKVISGVSKIKKTANSTTAIAEAVSGKK